MIHEKGISLSGAERHKLAKSAGTQEELILSILKGNFSKSFAFFDLVQITGFNQDSVKRSLSNLSGSDSTRRDDFEQFPVIKRVDFKKRNPRTGIKVSTYQWNPGYGKQPKEHQGDLFPSKSWEV